MDGMEEAQFDSAKRGCQHFGLREMPRTERLCRNWQFSWGECMLARCAAQGTIIRSMVREAGEIPTECQGYQYFNWLPGV